jgi:hypothetical protein
MIMENRSHHIDFGSSLDDLFEGSVSCNPIEMAEIYAVCDGFEERV